MEFRILGPLEVVDGARTITIRPGNDRAVLALLLLRGNEAVSSDRLVDELWGNEPPPTALKVLQSSVSRLRRQLGAGRIETRGAAYVLRVAADELDADRFEQLIRGGRPREALALWRGPPFDGQDVHRSAADAARRLNELRVDALEARIDDDIAAGRADAVISELEALTRGQPFRERLHGLLMRALYAEGRQKEALDAYRRVRRSLVDELGLEPGPELQELERAILRQDPSLPRTQRRPKRSRRRLALPAAAVALAAVAAVAVALARSQPAPVTVAANSVVAIDPGDNRIVDDIPLGAGAAPGPLAAGATGIWVTNGAQQSVVRIDPATHRILRAYDVGGAAADVALEGERAWIVTGNDGTLFRIDVAADTQTPIPLPPSPAGAFAVATGGGAVWVAADTLLKIDPRTGTTVGRATGDCCAPIDIAVGSGAVWVVERDEQLSKVGAESLQRIARHDLGEIDGRVALGTDSIWVIGESGFDHRTPALLWRIDPATGVSKAENPLGRPFTGQPLQPNTIAVGGGAVWVSIADTRTVYRIDPATGDVVARIRTPRVPYAIAYGDGRLWVSVR